MSPFSFWKTWPATYQRVFWIFASFLMAALVLFGVANLETPRPVFTEEHLQQLEPLETTVHNFQVGINHLVIKAENYLVFERVLGGALHPNGTAAIFFVCFLLAGITFMVSIVTTLPRFWFFSGMGISMVLIVSLRLDTLAFGGMTNKVPVAVALILYGSCAYFFAFIRPTIRFITRLILFSTITLCLATGIVFLARVQDPFTYLAANGITAGIVFAILFIFTVAHEIIASFIYVVTRSERPTRSLQHFLVITAVYLINLGLIYADKKHLIEWNFFSVNLFLLVTISGLLGIWGFRQREPQYEAIFPANPFGTYCILGLGCLGFGGMAYFIATANDPVVQLLKDAILYSHLGYGIIFVTYVISNFFPLLGNNMQVYKVLYKPTTMPYFTYRLAGLIATFTFFAYSNWKVSVNQAYAGYYNAVGDYYLGQDTLLAESNYQRSVYFATRNYHAHYALAGINGWRNNYEKVKEEYHNLADGRPLDLAYLNLSQLYETDNALPEAVTVLKQGLKDFPANPLLQNALSLLSARLNKPDTALILAKAARTSLSKSEAETNLAGLSAKFRVRYPVDSILVILNESNPGVKTNLLALATLQGVSVPLPVDPGSDTLLTVYTASTLNNYLINHLDDADTTLISKVIRLARKPCNAFFKDHLLAGAAQCYYAAGQTALAFKYMHEVAFMGQQAKYYNTLGLWAVEQGAPESAIHFFEEAISRNLNIANYHQAIAITETGDLNLALAAWEKLQSASDREVHDRAAKMIVLLKAKSNEAAGLVDEEKYEFSRHRFALDQEAEFKVFIETLKDPEIKIRAILDRCRKLDEADETQAALHAFELIKDVKVTNQELYQEILHVGLRLLARQKQWNALNQQLQTGIKFEGADAIDKIYFEALFHEQAGEKEAAMKKYTFLSTANPFYEDALLAALTYLDQSGQEKLKTFSTLVYAMDINPNSVKLLKAYALQSAALGYDDLAQSAMDKLKILLPPRSFAQFILDNPKVFQVIPN